MGSRGSADRSGSRRVAGIGFEFAAAVGGFAAVGYWIGGHYGRGDLGLAIGGVLGVVGAMYNLLRVAVTASRKSSGGDGTSDGKPAS